MAINLQMNAVKDGGKGKKKKPSHLQKRDISSLGDFDLLRSSQDIT